MASSGVDVGETTGLISHNGHCFIEDFSIISIPKNVTDRENHSDMKKKAITHTSIIRENLPIFSL